MGTDVGRLLRLAALLAVLGTASPCRAQVNPYRVNEQTTIASVRFEVPNGSVLAPSGLRNRIATKGPSSLGEILSWLPFVGREPPPLFDPVTLQRDVVRLENFYRDNGHSQVQVDYRLEVNEIKNSVVVVLTIDPGEPRRLAGLSVEIPAERDTAGLALSSLEGELEAWRGRRLGSSELQTLEEILLTWSSERGYPFPTVESRLEGQDPLFPTLVLSLDPGWRATVDQIAVSGNDRLEDETVRQQILVRSGQPYRLEQINESERLLLEAEILQVALINPVPSQVHDSLVDLDVRVVEGTPRLVHARTGYDDAAGILGEAGWEHRDMLGDARTFSVGLTAETGLWSLQETKNRRFGLSLSLKEPSFLSPRTSTFSSLNLEHEESAREVARSAGAALTLVHQRGPQRYLSVEYNGFLKDLLEFRGGGLGALGFLETLRLLEEAAERTSFQAGVTVSASWASRDILTATDRGWSVRGAVEVAGLDPWSDSQYVRLAGSTSLRRTLGDTGIRLLFNGRVGRIRLFGRSGPGSDPLRTYTRLGDVLFTEGGTDRVRGWDLDLLGPKVPEFSFETVSDSVQVMARDRYVPLGGLARWGGSLELQIPLPLARGRHFGLFFLDGGRVWTPDAFLLEEDGFPLLSVDNDAFYGAGTGLSLNTAVGAIGLMVGYKLNPSNLDVRDPKRVGEAVLAEAESLESVRESTWRRWHFHLRLGLNF